MWSDEVKQELGYILWSCIKKLFNWYSCSTQVKAMHMQQSKAKRKGTVFKLFKSMHGYICDHGEDYC